MAYYQCPECGSLVTHQKNAMERTCFDCENAWETEDAAGGIIGQALSD